MIRSLILSALTVATAMAAPQKIVFIAGHASHGPGEHEHKAGCMLLADHLNKSGLNVNAVVTTNGWPKDPAVFEGMSALVIYADGSEGHPAIPHLDEMKAWAAKGVGIGCMHWGVEVPKGPSGDAFLELIGGYFEPNYSVNPVWDGDFKLPKNPVTRGIHDFKTTDEWYYHMRFPADMKGVTPILSALPPASSLTRPDGPHEGNPDVRAAVLERKEVQTVMWTFAHPAVAGKPGEARGFGFSGGHYHKNWQNDDQRRLVLNTILWIAHVDVPEDGIKSATPTDEEMKANLDKK